MVATDLERFVEADGRADAVKEVRRRIDAEGDHSTSTTNSSPSPAGSWARASRAQHWETIAQKGFQLVYGATANLFTDRHGNYIGYGPEAAELVGVPEPDTFEVLPWDSRVARVWCICFRNREERKHGRRVPLLRLPREPQADAGGVREGHRAPPARRHGARDDVAQARRGREALDRGHDQALLLPHRPVLRAPADHPQGGRATGRSSGST